MHRLPRSTSDHRSPSRPVPFTDLDRQWERSLRRLPTDQADVLRQTLDATQGNNDEADSVLAAVVRLARGGDEIAGLLALKRVVPGLAAIAGRRARAGYGTKLGLLEELTTVAWLCIREYPIDRRPRRIGSNIVRDAEYLVFVRDGRLRRLTLEPLADRHERAATCNTSSAAEVLDLLAEARPTCSAQSLQLLGRIAIGEQNLDEIASDLRCTIRTVLNRRKAAEAELRDALAA